MDKVKKSFSEQWSYFKSGDKTWNQTLEERKRMLLFELGLSEKQIRGKRVLDIGCGNGTISKCFSDMGAFVTGIDISDSVKEAKMRYPEIDFFQINILDIGFFTGEKFDIVYSKGVLHHTGDTYGAFNNAVDLVKKGGILYVWLYSKSTGFKWFTLKFIKPITKRLPFKKVFFVPIALLRMVREGKSYSEAMVNTFDFFSCPYRDEYDEIDIEKWFIRCGFTDIRLTNRVPEGFGFRGVKIHG
jgi:SAM-dependent methyltransferase